MWRVQAEMKITISCMADLEEELQELQADPLGSGAAALAEVDAQFAEMEHWVDEQQGMLASLAKQTQRLQLEL